MNENVHSEEPEYELRFLEVDLERVTHDLLRQGATLLWSGPIEATVMRHEEVPDGWLRVRREGDQTEVVLKRRVQADEFSEEVQQVTDPSAAEEHYQQQGWSRVRRTKKIRTSYMLNGIRYDFDQFRMLPTYLEIEAPSREALLEGARIIGIDPADAFHGSSLFAHYGLSNSPFIE